jgi:hypothetical protein
MPTPDNKEECNCGAKDDTIDGDWKCTKNCNSQCFSDSFTQKTLKEFDEKFGIFSNYADFCPDKEVYKSFIHSALNAQREETILDVLKVIKNYGICTPYIGALVLNMGQLQALLESKLLSYNNKENE